jgi:hypothetical protein
MSFLDPVPAPQKKVDFRAWLPAWIIAGAIVLLIAVAYVIWVNRPRAGYNTRSLSASHSNPAKSAPVTKSLHVDGCHEDFIVNPGELVEPRLAPGAPIEQFRSIYGDELTGKDLRYKGLPDQPPSTHQWNTDALQLAVSEPGINASQQPARIQMSLNSGHIVESLDGIELGLDSFGTILRKMRDKKVEIHQRIRHVPNEDPTKPDHWILTVSLYSSCGKAFRSEYFRSIATDEETDRQINRREPGTNGQPGPLRSDVFMNKVAYDYILETSNGSDDDPSAGEPAERE